MLRSRVDCLDVVENMRKNRGGMVQHPQQYEFVVKACVQHGGLRTFALGIAWGLIPVLSNGHRPSLLHLRP